MKALEIFDKINNGHGIGFGDHNQFILNSLYLIDNKSI